MFLVMLGGALGTLARYELGRLISSQTWAQGGFPYGTFIINVTGSFILGAAAAFLVDRPIADPVFADIFTFIGIGVCGGYTTFSTFELETYRLVRDGSWRLALLYVVASVIVGFIGVLAGVSLVKLVWPGK
jgi:CrcB protein